MTNSLCTLQGRFSNSLVNVWVFEKQHSQLCARKKITFLLVWKTYVERNEFAHFLSSGESFLQSAAVFAP